MNYKYFDAKRTTNDLWDLNISWLNEHNYFIGHKHGGITWTDKWNNKASVSFTVRTCTEPNYIEFSYTKKVNGIKKDFRYKSILLSTACNFGGVRYWFVCPLSKDGLSCKKKVSTLYLGDSGFGCRHCYELTYESRNRPKSGRFYYLNKMWDKDAEAEKLEREIKIRFRNGKPTKKFERLMELRKETYESARKFNKYNQEL
jgi:hypothetical protein